MEPISSKSRLTVRKRRKFIQDKAARDRTVILRLQSYLERAMLELRSPRGLLSSPFPWQPDIRGSDVPAPPRRPPGGFPGGETLCGL